MRQWLALLLFSCAPPLTAEEITIAEYGEFPLYAALYIAEARGYFREQGLEVRVLPAGGDEKVFAALLRGDAHFGIGDPTFVAIAGQRGAGGKVIFALLENVPAWGVARGRAVQPISEPRALARYTVATYPAPSTAYTLQKRLFRTGGLEPKIRELPYGSLLAALEAGAVDIALEYEPNVSLALEKGAHEVYSLSAYFPEFALTGLTVLPEYLAANRVTAKKVVSALQRGTDTIYRAPEEAVAVLEKRFPEYAPAVLRRAIARTSQAGSFSKTGTFRRKAWEAAVSVRREVGDLEGDAPFDQYVDTSVSAE